MYDRLSEDERKEGGKERKGGKEEVQGSFGVFSGSAGRRGWTNRNFVKPRTRVGYSADTPPQLPGTRS